MDVRILLNIPPMHEGLRHEANDVNILFEDAAPARPAFVAALPLARITSASTDSTASAFTITGLPES
jgi:hypothetical protein